MKNAKEFLIALVVCLFVGTMIFPNNTLAASVPSAPTHLTATTTSSNTIDLEWYSVSSANAYYVYRATSSSGTYTKVATVYSTSYTDTGLSSNTTYYYKVKAYNSYGTSDYSVWAYSTTNYYGSSTITSNRLAGQTRYETSATIADAGWDSSYYAVIASGEDFPDALCGTPLAGRYDAPILLTSRFALDYETRLKLSQLKVQYVFIIGGTGVIASNVEQEIKNMGITVARVAGKDRYETSIKVAERMGYVNQAILATGDNFPDALSIAPIAAMKGLPILLTEKDRLSSELKKYLSEDISSTVVVGGTGAVSNYVFNQLPSPKRLSGNSRYETNLNIVKAYIGDLNFDTCYLATGENFPDALAGSALASLRKSPLILVNNGISLSTTTLLDDQNVNHVVAFGGTGVVSDSVLLSLGSSTSDSSKVPSAPINLYATSVGSDEIYLNWSSVAKATSYYIYRATSSNGTYYKIDTVSSTYYYDTDLSEDYTYYYKIQAHNSAGTSSYSSRVSATTDYDNTLDAPDDLEATTISSSQIHLTWDSVYDATSYYVYRATSSSGTYTKIATVSTEYYTDSGLAANTTYYYKVQARRSGATSSYSARTYATTLSNTAKPATPTNLKATPLSSDQISLTWNSVGGAGSYIVYRASATSGPYTEIATVPSNKLIDTGLTPGPTYYYKVKAYNGNLSSDSEVVNTKTLLPILVEGFVAENFNTNDSTDYVGVNVGWNLGANTNIGNINAIKVELYDSKNNLMATNTGVINQLKNIQSKQFSTAFIISEGTYKKVSDPYWSFGTWAPKENNPPVKAKITLTDIYERVYTVENGNLASEVGKAWADLFDSPK